ncbi:MAG: radical SAM protein [Thermodesulfovibrionales bacterium]
MKIRALLINPWIYDFSAHNLWAMPLGLFKVAEYLSQYDVELSYIDCLKINKTRQYNTGKYAYKVITTPDIIGSIRRRFKVYGITEEEFVSRLRMSMPLDIIFITTVMSYWYIGAKRAIELIREICGDIPIVLGGIYATLYPEHALSQCNPCAVCIGRAEDSLKIIIESFGFKLRRIKDSPTSYYKLNIYSKYPYAPVLTSYGCPFRCIYCASHILNGSYTQRDQDDVLEEIIEFYNHGVMDIAFYDDALLYNSENHIKPILRYISEKGLTIRLHTPNGLHCRFIDDELAYLFRRSGFRTIRLGYETFNKQRQMDTGGKTTDSDLVTAIRHLKGNGFEKRDIGVYLMYGLPHQELKEVKQGIEFLMGLGVQIRLTEYSPIRGTEAWRSLVDSGIIDDELDPLLTNNSIFSEMYSNYDADEVKRLKWLVKEYNNS